MMSNNKELLLRPKQKQRQPHEQQTQKSRRGSVRTKLLTHGSVMLFFLCAYCCLLIVTFMMLQYGMNAPPKNQKSVYVLEESLAHEYANIIDTSKMKAKENNTSNNKENISKYNQKNQKEAQDKEKGENQQQGIESLQRLRKEQEKVMKEKQTVTTTVTPTANSNFKDPAKPNAKSSFSSISKHTVNDTERKREEEEGEEKETFWTPKDKEDYAESLKPWANLTTIAHKENFWYAGYRNQMMAFSAFIIDVQQHYPNGGVQILLNNLRHKDLYGSNKKIPHELMFDVRLWNSFYPRLPRLVSCDPAMHFDYDCKNNHFIDERNRTKVWAATSPKSWGKSQMPLFVSYIRLQTKSGRLWNNHGKPKQLPNPTDLLMMKYAIKLNPELNALVEKAEQSITEENNSNNKITNSVNRRAEKRNEQNSINKNAATNSSHGGDINNDMVLHARIESDMIDHNVCLDRKLSNLTTIFQYMESTFKDNPPSTVIVLTNMKLLEPDVIAKLKNPNTKMLANENANALHSAFKTGLWNGTVKVIQIGNNPVLNVPHYERYKVTIGAAIDFDLSLNAKYFIGTEVSSFSSDVLRSRFYGGGSNYNFRYHPRGLFRWTDENTTIDTLPSFEC